MCLCNYFLIIQLEYFLYIQYFSIHKYTRKLFIFDKHIIYTMIHRIPITFPKKRFLVQIATFVIFYPQYRHYIFYIFCFLFLFSVKRFSINVVHQRTMNRCFVRVCTKFQLPTFEILPATYMFARFLIMLRFY